jgi:hypothetical protein
MASASLYEGWGHCPQWGPEDEVPQKLKHFHNYLPAILVLGESKMRGERQTQPMVWVRGKLPGADDILAEEKQQFC